MMMGSGSRSTTRLRMFVETNSESHLEGGSTVAVPHASGPRNRGFCVAPANKRGSPIARAEMGR
jgi:hypothetical protein